MTANAGAHTGVTKWRNSTYQMYTPVNVLSGTAVMVRTTPTVLKSLPGCPTHRNQHPLLRGQAMSCGCMDCASSSSALYNQPCFLGRRWEHLFSRQHREGTACSADPGSSDCGSCCTESPIYLDGGRLLPSRCLLPAWQYALLWSLWSV